MSDILVRIKDAEIELVSARAKTYDARRRANGNTNDPDYIRAVFHERAAENEVDRLFYEGQAKGLW